MTNQTAIMKLINGDTIVCKVSLTTERLVTIHNPLLLTFRPKTDGAASLIATKWMESDQTEFSLKSWHVVSYARPSEYICNLYDESLNDLDDYEDNQNNYDEWEDELISSHSVYVEDDVTH